MIDDGRYIAIFLKEARKKANLTAREASEKLAKMGVKLSGVTISGYENNRSKPDAPKFLALCSIYGISNPIPIINEIMNQNEGLYLIDADTGHDEFYLSGGTTEDIASFNETVLNFKEQELLKNYRDLNTFNQDTINMLVSRMVQGCQVAINTIQKPLYYLAVSAGTGQFLDSDDYEMKDFPEDVVPRESTFAVRVSGDSMEPDYPDGSIVFVQHAKNLNPGEVGVFVLNGDGYIKELGNDSNLISFNPRYKDIRIGEYDDLRIVGKVVGKPYLEK